LYAEACFANFGDRVKRWITINEPLQTAINGYGIGIFAPGGCQGETARCYLAAHHQILAHAAAVDVYRRKFKAAQSGEVGLVVDCEWAEPFSEKLEDQIAAQRRIDFQLGWYVSHDITNVCERLARPALRVCGGCGRTGPPKTEGLSGHLTLALFSR